MILGSGTTTLTKVGSSVTSVTQNSTTSALALTGANAFTGAFNLNAGKLILNNSMALSTGTLNIAAGTTLDASANGLNITNVQNWLGDFTYAGSSSVLNANGNVTMTGNRTVTVTANTLVVNGVIDDGGNGYSLTKSGAGTLTLAGSNTFTGDLAVSGGL